MSVIQNNFLFLGEHCEIKTIFKDSVAGANVNVKAPELVIKDIDDNVMNLRYLVPLCPTGAKDGEYYSTFLTEGLSEGRYYITATGYYPDDTTPANKLTNTDEIEVRAIDTVQGYINVLREQLNDHLPMLYLIDDPEKYRWSDGELYNCLKRSVAAYNETPPVSLTATGSYTLDNFPHFDLMLWGAEFYALNQKGLLEIFNTIIYNDDISFTIDRFPKLMQKLAMLIQNWLIKMKEMKKDEMWRRAKPVGIKSTKLPGRVIRNLSFVPAFSFLGNSGY